MGISDRLKINLEIGLQTRISKQKPQDNSIVLCQVVGYKIETGTFTGKAPDGSLRYFRFIGNASLPIGSQVSVTLPDKGLIGWADTKSR